jgi:hypothetical protein
MTTYLEIVNLGLDEINETPLTVGTFLSPRSVQRFAKGAANKAYFDIANESVEWPWLASTVSRIEGTEILPITAGIQWYDIPSPDLDVDWHTFYMTDKDPDVLSETEATVSKDLTYITYEQWGRMNRTTDNQRTSVSRAEPVYVVRHPNGKMGFSPVPDVPYFVEYLTWETAVSFSQATDVLPFPEEFINVILNRIRYYLWLSRENLEQAGFAKSDYETSLASMKRILLSNKSERMRAV